MAQLLFSGDEFELLSVNLEFAKDLEELRALGLTEEDIDGYIDFYSSKYFKDLS